MKFDLVINASRKAANFLVRDFNEISYFKNSQSRVRDFIDKSKIRTQEIISGELQRYFPDHKILSISDATCEPDGNYIVFDPLEALENMENLIPFFSLTMFVSTTVKNTTTNFAIINLPVIDQICYTATNQNVWIENYQSSHKKKGLVSSVSNLIVTRQINSNLLELVEQNKIDLNLIRCFGSSAYATLLLVNGGAGQYASENNDWLAEKITGLIAENAGAKNHSQNGMNFYTTHKASHGKTLRLAK
jgi:fructose-1,6-bisphosphatase/inositol monophosphatase family enzyme